MWQGTRVLVTGGISFIKGLHRTIDWYFATKNREEVKAILGRMLTER
jgi:hypothetical protein